MLLVHAIVSKLLDVGVESPPHSLDAALLESLGGLLQSVDRFVKVVQVFVEVDKAMRHEEVGVRERQNVLALEILGVENEVNEVDIACLDPENPYQELLEDVWISIGDFQHGISIEVFFEESVQLLLEIPLPQFGLSENFVDA